MKKLVSLMLVCVCFNVVAGEKVNKTVDVDSEGVVEIHNVRGEIDIKGWDKNQVKVSGTLDDLAEEFIFTTEGRKTIIKVKLPRNSRYHNRDGSNLSIWVPVSSKVNFSGVATDLDIERVEGGLDINSVSGDMNIRKAAGRTYINSVSGKIVLQELSGNMDVSTVSGDLDASVSAGQVNVSGVSADIKIKLDRIESAHLSNVSGDSILWGTLMKDGEIKLGSVSGEAFYYVNGELSARVSLETAPGGDIINDYSNDEPTSTFINSHNLRFTAGDGEGVIRMSTVSGNIGLKTQ